MVSSKARNPLLRVPLCSLRTLRVKSWPQGRRVRQGWYVPTNHTLHPTLCARRYYVAWNVRPGASTGVCCVYLSWLVNRGCDLSLFFAGGAQVRLEGQWGAGTFSITVTKAGFSSGSSSLSIRRGVDPGSPPVNVRVGVTASRRLRKWPAMQLPHSVCPHKFFFYPPLPPTFLSITPPSPDMCGFLFLLVYHRRRMRLAALATRPRT